MNNFEGIFKWYGILNSIELENIKKALPPCNTITQKDQVLTRVEWMNIFFYIGWEVQILIRMHEQCHEKDLIFGDSWALKWLWDVGGWCVSFMLGEPY